MRIKTSKQNNPYLLKRRDIAPNVISMGVADMDFDTPDFVMRAIKKYLKYGNLGYYSILEDFYQSVRNWYKLKQNYVLDDAYIIPSTGTLTAIRAIILGFTSTQDNILIQEPVYHYFKKIIYELDRIPMSHALEFYDTTYKINFDLLEDKLKKVKVFIMCSPHNPIGKIWSKEETLNILTLCEKYGVLVISDEIHSDLCMPREKFNSIYNIGSAQNKIILNSPTKTFNFPSLRGGFIIVRDKSLSSNISTYLSAIGAHSVNSIFITATTAAYNCGYLWNKEIINYIYKNYLYLQEYIQKHLPYLKLCKLQASYLVWVNYSAMKVDELTLINALSKHVIVHPGSIFGSGGEGFFRLNIACSSKTLKAALDKIASVCNTLCTTKIL